MTQERFVYRHKWQPGDILVWDKQMHTPIAARHSTWRTTSATSAARGFAARLRNERRKAASLHWSRSASMIKLLTLLRESACSHACAVPSERWTDETPALKIARRLCAAAMSSIGCIRIASGRPALRSLNYSLMVSRNYGLRARRQQAAEILGRLQDAGLPSGHSRSFVGGTATFRVRRKRGSPTRCRRMRKVTGC